MPSMSQITKPVFNQMLGAMSKILDLLAAHCDAKKIDASVFLTARLYPDMFPFTKQVQIATDFSKGAIARLSGKDAPVFADDEVTIEQVKARIANTLAFINSVPDSEIDGTEAKIVTMTARGQDMSFPGDTYVSHVVLPNVHFHCATAYGILRHNGLEMGKMNYLGRV